MKSRQRPDRCSPSRQALLEADPLRRAAQRVAVDVSRPQRQYPRLFRGEVVALAVGEGLENPGNGFAALLHAPIALLAADAGRHVDALVNHGEIAIVVQHALVGAVARKYRHPEIDIRL
jgi:hypothetical protein